MAVRAVIFDWGGTLTPWHTVDHAALWRDVCALHFAEELAERNAAAIRAAESELWRAAESESRSATMDHVFERAGVVPTEAFLDSYFEAWEPHTLTDPDVAELFPLLRAAGIKIGVLSNTMWPRSAHEQVFIRDGVLELIDGAVYSSEIDWTKPHPEAFRAAMRAVGVAEPPAACSSATGRTTTCTARSGPGCAPSWFRTATCRRIARPSRTRSSAGSAT